MPCDEVLMVLIIISQVLIIISQVLIIFSQFMSHCTHRWVGMLERGRKLDMLRRHAPQPRIDEERGAKLVTRTTSSDRRS